MLLVTYPSMSVLFFLLLQEREGFVSEVKMWVYEEMVNGRKLTEIINETHCNEKYLPDFTLPDNVVYNTVTHTVEPL